MSYFDSLFTKQGRLDPIVTKTKLENIPTIVLVEDNIDLLKPIKEEEIINAIWNIEPHKPPGSDKFSISFYISFWSLIKINLKIMLH
jgi:hypothetical protein